MSKNETKVESCSVFESLSWESCFDIYEENDRPSAIFATTGMRQTILIFSAIAVSLLILLNLRRLSILSADGDEELWTVVFAVVFLSIGIGLSRYVFPKKTQPQSEQVTDPEAELRKLGITQREYEVLKLVAEGHSNQEISNALFISESTVKTHVSNVLVKLDARRRTQAVQKAKELKIL